MDAAAKGELLLALSFAAIGDRLDRRRRSACRFWEGFAPQSGFLPLIYGMLLAGLSLAVARGLVRQRRREPASVEPIRKPLLVLAALAAAVRRHRRWPASRPSIFLLLLFLFAVVERLPLISVGDRLRGHDRRSSSCLPDLARACRCRSDRLGF